MAKKRFASWSVPRSKRIDRMNLWVEFECATCQNVKIVRRHSNGDGSEHFNTTTICRCRVCMADTVQRVIRVNTSDPALTKVKAVASVEVTA
ncbi:MAG: hypothetical protein WCT25_02685 [Candidatus Paceibacterota bacterium]|jgi:hypothetical protein